MKYTSIQSRREAILQALEQCRQLTLDRFTDLDEATFSQQAHPDFSPIGWHLGHIAFTEAYWILERCAGSEPLFAQYHQLFAADGLPKSQRQNLPTQATILDYLEVVRSQTLTYLKTAPLEQEERLWRWLLQHESQHNETMSFVLQLHRRDWEIETRLNFSGYFSPLTPESTSEMISIPAGEFPLGSNEIDAQDNERPQQIINLETYWLDRYPVTCGQYREFMAAGGYQKPEFWSERGWKWLETNPVSHPLYWSNSPDWEHHPVCGVSYYEAEAYANFVGKRLPTEAEWEKAASWDAHQGKKRRYPWGDEPANSHRCNYNALVGHTTPVHAYPEGQSAFGCYDMLGNVWEWTASWFAGYEGFSFYPYRGYSQAYFDNQHRVLRGGSWVTRPWGLRNSFRNWYHPWVRQLFTGFRCVR